MAFYLIIFMLLVGVFYLLWINRNLLIKNLVLLIGGAAVGAIIAAVFSYILVESKLANPRLSTFLYLSFPITCATLALQNAKNKIFFDAEEKALLFTHPALVFKSYALSHVVGLSLSVLVLVATLGIDKIAFAFLLVSLKMVAGLIATLVIASFVVAPSKKYGVLFSLLFGSTAFLLLLMDSVFALPVIAYAIVTPYLLVYFIVLGKEKEKQLTIDS